MSQTSRKADLHLHTTHSDGYCSPRELIDKALAVGLVAISITDHDSVSAISEAILYGKDRGVEVIPGIELSVNHREQDIHILGYCFDYRNQNLTKHLSLFKEERILRAEKIVKKLEEIGMPISFDAVMKKAGEGTVGRPHIANVLIEDGFVYSFQEAFDKYIGHNRPANVDKYKIDLPSALTLIQDAGGICSVAHPGIQLTKQVLSELIKSGVHAIEAIHPKHSPQEISYYESIATKNALLITGGSDFHGGSQGEDSLGKYTVSYEMVDTLKFVAGYHLTD